MIDINILNRVNSRSLSRTLAAAMLLAAGLLLALPQLARADTLASACTKSYAPQTLEITQPINLGQLKNQLYFYVCSGAYDSDANKVTTAAQAYLAVRASQVSKPALVLDIDETSLSNLPQELANDFGYINDVACTQLPKGPCGFNNWVLDGKAKAIEGTLALFKAARQHNVAVFFITGRHDSDPMRAVTIKNLTEAGYEGWAGLSLRPDGDNRTVIGYKSAEREKIAGEGYTIIVNVGDQHSDLLGGFAERAYKLPNPMYFIP